MATQEIAVRSKQEVSHEEPTRPGRTYVPDVDIYETTEGLRLWADMPGVEESSVQVHLVDGVLSIEGRVDVKEYEDLNPVYTEYKVGNYARRFSVSEDIDVDRIKARMTNGVLEIDLPKTERAKPRRIAISTK